MSLSSKILRSIVAAEFSVDPSDVRVSGYIAALPTYKDWYGFYQSKNGYVFKKIEPFIENPLFLVCVFKGKVTIHTPKFF